MQKISGRNSVILPMICCAFLAHALFYGRVKPGLFNGSAPGRSALINYKQYSNAGRLFSFFSSYEIVFKKKVGINTQNSIEFNCERVPGDVAERSERDARLRMSIPSGAGTVVARTEARVLPMPTRTESEFLNTIFLMESGGAAT